MKKKYKITISVYASESDKFFFCSKVVEATDFNDARSRGYEEMERLKKDHPDYHCTISDVIPV